MICAFFLCENQEDIKTPPVQACLFSGAVQFLKFRILYMF